MNDEAGVQIVGARSKRTHQQMSGESGEGSSRSWTSNFLGRPETIPSRPPRLPHIRTARDGYDLRSPAHGTTQEEEGEAVIDLTEEPETPPQHASRRLSESRSSNSRRLPRFGRNILDNIVDLEADEEDPPDNPTGGPSSSPEVQFVGSTTRRQPLPSRNFSSLSMRRSHFAPPNPRRHAEESSMISSFLSSVPLLGRNHLGGFAPPDMDSFFLGPNLIRDTDLGQLDYAMSAFPMGGSTSQQTTPPRRNEYKPPSPAPEGFTRTLGEEDVAVCPNCYWELGTGEGKKQEIWVAKQCGHVYCGECTENRSLSKAKKTQGTPKTKPFSKCQVLECGKSVSAPTSMIHLYL